MVLGRSEEKRGFRRMAVDCPLTFAIDGQPGRHAGRTTDLSASGLSFTCEAVVDQGATLEVEVSPATALTPPLHARVEVLRVEDAEAGRRVSCRIVEMLT